MLEKGLDMFGQLSGLVIGVWGEGWARFSKLFEASGLGVWLVSVGCFYFLEGLVTGWLITSPRVGMREFHLECQGLTI